ncbi:MAG: hypothetical protein ABS79_01440 [Planctomycetes bacterium SCN 63-9]|nr:MAG: hypothetical protein ABS79_01440 [Planctomycetes bacterium SCN 63-9]
MLSFAVLALASGRTHAVSAVVIPPPPAAAVTVDGETIDLSRFIKPVDESAKFFSLDATLEVNGNSIHVTALYNTDPFITFGVTTTNFGPGPVAYSFLFGTPIVPGFYNNATSTGGVSFTNGASGTSTITNGGSYAPAYISGYGTVGLVPTNLGVDIGVGPVVSGPGIPFTVTTIDSFGPAGTVFAPTFYDNLEAIVSYTQSDIGSVASWSGAITLNAVVPEPTSMAMLGMGILMIGGSRVLRRRKA